MSAVDCYLQAPSTTIARMASRFWVGLNNIMACAANVLGDMHGDPEEQAVVIYLDIAA
ncbi:hypothetical protein [Acidovorax sp. Leaf73]|uniref:hypothetical protein n=1 Tax=Acidovorax sp. Leaf73 TaxID=2876566 RepID=UPI001E342F39|nr:hypothetical protein [Acidovorax sp. Leaf73]